MRFAVWIFLYGVIAFASIPFFARLSFSYTLKQFPRLLDEPAASGKLAAKKREAVASGIIAGLAWPASLIGLLLVAMVQGFSFKLPPSMERERMRQRNRKIIEDFGKEEGL